MKRLTVSRFRMVGLLLGIGLAATFAQAQTVTVDDNFHSPLFTRQAKTGADGSPSRGVVVQPDDSFLTFKNFTRLDQQAVGPLVKFNADGSRDESLKFNDESYSSIDVTARTGDGKLVVSAFREDKAGRDDYRVLRLLQDGSIDSTFDSGTGSDKRVRALLPLADGKILVGGDFATFSGSDRSCLLRLDASGLVDTSLAALSFATNSTYWSAPSVHAIALQSDGQYVIAGFFNSVNGVSLDHVARLNDAGVLDSSFTPSGFKVYGQGEEEEFAGEAVAIQSDDRILLAGRFDTGEQQINPPPYRPMIRLNTDGAFDTFFGTSTWPPEAYGVKILRNGHVLFAGSNLYETDADGNELPDHPVLFFNASNPDDYPRAYQIGEQSSGDLLVAGADLIGEVKRGGLARLHADETLDSFYAGEFQAEVLPDKVKVASDGRIYVSGTFDRIDGVLRIGFARLLANGNVDSGFDPAPALGFYEVTDFDIPV